MPTARFCAPLSRLPPPLRRLSLHPLQSILRGRPGGTPRTDPALPPAQGLLTCFSLTSPRLPGRPTRRAVQGPSPLLLLQSGVPGRRAASFAHRLSLRIAALTARRRAQLPVEWLRDQVAPRQARVSPPPGQVRICFPGGGGGGGRSGEGLGHPPALSALPGALDSLQEGHGARSPRETCQEGHAPGTPLRPALPERHGRQTAPGAAPSLPLAAVPAEPGAWPGGRAGDPKGQ